MVKIQLLNTGEELIPQDNFPVAITKAVSEIQDLSKRKGSFSKTITFIGDKDTNKILGHYYDINLEDSSFNRKAITPVRVVQDGQEILNGNMRLLSINNTSNIANVDNKITYEAIIYNEVGNFFQKLQGQELSNIGLTEFDHSYSAANVVASFDHTWVEGYKYTLPYTDDNTYDLVDLKPGIYARQIWNKIFANAGFSYQWDSIDAEDIRFSDLILPYTGDVLKFQPEEFTEIYAEVENQTAQTYTSPLGLDVAGSQQPWNPIAQNPILGPYATEYLVEAPTVIVDEGDNYSSVNSRYVMPIWATGAQSFKTRVKVNLDLNLIATVDSLIGTNSTAALPSGENVGWDYKVRFQAINQNNELLQSGTVSLSQVVSDGPNYFQINTGTTNIESGLEFDFIITSPNLQQGDSIRLIIIGEPEIIQENTSLFPRWREDVGTPGTGDFVEVRNQVVINNINVEYYPDPEAVGFGANMSLNKVMPKMKQTDFIKGILNLYNLYVDIDTENPNRLVISTRDDFYDSGDTQDWTKLLVKDLDQKIAFASEQSSRLKTLKYKEGKTLFNEEYQNRFAQTYGQFTYVLDDQNLRGEDVIELPFSPSQLTSTQFGAIVHAMPGFAPKGNPKIVLDGGKLPVSQGFNIVDYYQEAGGQSPVGELGLTEYAYTGHYNNPFVPTLDINFANPIVLGYNQIQSYTANNMFNLHWRRTFNQINDSKTLEAFFWLDPITFAQTKLNDKIFVHDSYYNIVEITDYDATGKRPTKVKLIQVDNQLSLGNAGSGTGPTPDPSNPFPPLAPDFEVGVGNPNTDTPIAELAASYIQSKNIDLGSNNVVRGKYNYLSPESKNNFIGGNSNIVEGIGNSIYGDSYLVQRNNTIQNRSQLINSDELSTVTGNRSTILASDTSVIVGDNSNIVAPRDSSVDGNRCNIVASNDSNITKTILTPIANTIVGGINNNIEDSVVSSIFGSLSSDLVRSLGTSSSILDTGSFIDASNGTQCLTLATTNCSITSDSTPLSSQYIIGSLNCDINNFSSSPFMMSMYNSIGCTYNALPGAALGFLSLTSIANSSNVELNSSAISTYITNSTNSVLTGVSNFRLDNSDNVTANSIIGVSILNSTDVFCSYPFFAGPDRKYYNINNSLDVSLTDSNNVQVDNSTDIDCSGSEYVSVINSKNIVATDLEDATIINVDGGTFDSTDNGKILLGDTKILGDLEISPNSLINGILTNDNGTPIDLFFSDTIDDGQTAVFNINPGPLGHPTSDPAEINLGLTNDNFSLLKFVPGGIIVNSFNSTVSAFGSVILGGNNITATQNNTVYVPNLVVTQSITPTGTADTIGETGQVTYDDDYVYVKTSAGWKRSALSTF